MARDVESSKTLIRAPVGCCDGMLMPAAEVTVSAADTGLARGDGVFEVVRLYDGAPFALEDHLARLARSASALRLAYPDERLAQECARTCQAIGARDCNLRIIVTRGGRRLILEEPIARYADRARIMLVPHLVTPLLAGVKSLSYAANCQALRLVGEHGCDDALFVSAVTGEILEAPFASIVWVTDGALFTPPLAAGLLDSITLRAVCEIADVRERTCTTAALRDADEACLVSTTREIQPVAEIVGVRVFNKRSPVVSDLAAAYRRHVEMAVTRMSETVPP